MQTRPALAALLLVLCSLAAHSQTQPTRIDVLGSALQPVRTDLQRLCPDALDDLPDQLAATAQDVAAHSVVQVRFELEGSRVRAVHTQGGVGKQARAVQRAVRGLACSSETPVRQTVRFSVRFVDPFDRTAPRAVAIIDTPATP